MNMHKLFCLSTLFVFNILSIKAQDKPYSTIKYDTGIFFDQTEVDVGSWLSYYTWTLIHKGYEAAQKVLPDSSAVEPELWDYIKGKSADYIDVQGAYSMQPIGYFGKECSTCTKFGKRLDSDHRYCAMLNFPVTGLTYEQVVGFCEWRTRVEGNGKFVFRLPTPEEWADFAKMGLSAAEKNNNTKDSLLNGQCPMYNYNIRCDWDKDSVLGNLTGIGLFKREKSGAFDVFGNVSEMTSVKGIAKGGNFRLHASQCHPDSVQHYAKPELWLGFRCIAVKVVNSNVNSGKPYHTLRDSSNSIDPNSRFGQFTDPRDGKTYPTVRIGDQTWLAANLAYKPESGDYWAYNNEQSNIEQYGYLYSWETAKNACPDGWHLPNKMEFEILLQEVEGEGLNEYIELRPSGSSGLVLINCGLRYGINYTPISSSFAFWSSTEKNKKNAWGLGVDGLKHMVRLYDTYGKKSGLPVRCVKNTP